MSRLCILIYLFSYFQKNVAVRVCDTVADYFNPFSTNCEFTYDIYLNATELMQTWDCEVKEHHLLTDDGYLILVTEVYKKVTKHNPILVCHGIALNGNAFIYRDQKSLTYNFVKNGYRVFILNFRGSKYSVTHLQWTTEDLEFWDFSFHEMGVYDIKEATELIKRETGEKAILVGYSMGATASLVYGSLYPEDAKDKLKGMLEIAPSITFTYAKTLFKVGAKFWSFLEPIFKKMWRGRFLPNNYIMSYICASTPATMYLCQTIAFPFFGFDYGEVDVHDLPLIYLLDVDTASLTTAYHFVQIMNSGKFRQFDYGPYKNKKTYGSIFPPEYNITNIPIPVSIIVSENDYMSSVKDASSLKSKLHYPCGMTILEPPHWNHLDFITAKDVVKYLINIVLKKIAVIESDRCK